MLGEEIKIIGLDGIKVELLVLETGEGNKAYANQCGYYGYADRTKDGCFEIGINRRLDARRRNKKTIRDTVRHELAHIKYGDCESDLPEYMRQLFYNFVHEPRANAYARREFVESYSHDCISAIKRQVALFSKNSYS